jgi:hypothetical protein
MPTTSHRKFKLHRKKTKAVERALTRLNPVAANRPREPMSIDAGWDTEARIHNLGTNAKETMR